MEQTARTEQERRTQRMSTETEQTARTKRLKKDGTPDRRGGKLGNKGNKYATGRKHIDGAEVRKHISFMATEKEYRLLLKYAAILKDNYSHGLEILAALGTPPEGRAKKDSDRVKKVIRVLEAEKMPIRQMLSIIKDRYEAVYIMIGRE
jgi:hypothetical protein